MNDYLDSLNNENDMKMDYNDEETGRTICIKF